MVITVQQNWSLASLEAKLLAGPSSPLQLGSGAGLWWSALALLRTINGAIWWTTDTVGHQGAVGLRGGAHRTT
eukprot:4583739-Pyramimonas_sp.AAC.1